MDKKIIKHFTLKINLYIILIHEIYGETLSVHNVVVKLGQQQCTATKFAYFMHMLIYASNSKDILNMEFI